MHPLLIELADEARRLAALGLMACTGGNLSIRLPGEPDRVAVSAFGLDKGGIGPQAPQRRLFSRIDKRTRDSAWYGACDRAGVVVYAWPFDAAAMPRWLVARARGLGLTLDEPAAALLAGPATAATDTELWAKAHAMAAAIEAPRIPNRAFPVHGRADGRADARPAIQRAIAAASRAGGGRVVLGPGVWFSKGPIHLKSRIELHLAALIPVGLIAWWRRRSADRRTAEERAKQAAEEKRADADALKDALHASGVADHKS